MRLFVVVLILSVKLSTYSQNTILFENFLEAFESNNTQREIPVKVAVLILNDKIVHDANNIQMVEANRLFKFDDFLVSLIKIYEFSPIESSGYYLIKFSDRGEILDFSYLGGTFISLEGNSAYTNCEMVNDSVLEVHKTGGLSFETYEYYLISTDAYKKILPQPVLRPNAISSKKILRLNELRKMSLSELDIVRNEIFADHGYIFKTEKWKCYFDKQHWYSPLYRDVTDKLTIIERININNILIVSKEKRQYD